MTINANERITIKGTLSPLTGKPSSYRAGFFGYETITTPDTNGWYDDDGELSAELITGIEFGSHESESPLLWGYEFPVWEESDRAYRKDRIQKIITHMSIYDLKEAQKAIYRNHLESPIDPLKLDKHLESPWPQNKHLFFNETTFNLLQAIEREILSRSKAELECLVCHGWKQGDPIRIGHQPISTYSRHLKEERCPVHGKKKGSV